MTGRAWIVALGCGLQLSCTSVHWRARFLPPEVAPPGPSAEAPFLKVHGKDGSLLVLERWEVDVEARRIRGDGLRYDAGRRMIARGALEASFDDVALLETNQPEQVARAGLATLGVMAGVSLAVTAACIANPKACFGSCPTFYAGGPGGEALVAEGFSSSVASALEATDVDAIDLVGPRGPALDLVMRNEALETHLVRSLRLLAVPRPAAARVHRAGSSFVVTGPEIPPTGCRGHAGECLAAVASTDGAEYLSTASDRDLAERERIELVFPPVHGRSGLLVRGQNSLLNTFVFYQAMAWLGGRAGDVLSRLGEASGVEGASPELAPLLSRIEVEVLGASGWQRAGTFGETGPLARQTEVVPLPAQLPAGPVRVRLQLARGSWRIDSLALVELGGTAAAIAIEPSTVLRRGEEDGAALARLRGAKEHLVTFPGDEYTIRFALPDELRDAELFLESRGYYIEWIRQQWLAEEDPEAALRLFTDPRPALRRLAPAYKRIEPDIERIFWTSRVRGKP